ncbi:hypothetical protein AOLI_G00208780 [Acnodon oligacanthus]
MDDDLEKRKWYIPQLGFCHPQTAGMLHVVFDSPAKYEVPLAPCHSDVLHGEESDQNYCICAACGKTEASAISFGMKKNLYGATLSSRSANYGMKHKAWFISPAA